MINKTLRAWMPVGMLIAALMLFDFGFPLYSAYVAIVTVLVLTW